MDRGAVLVVGKAELLEIDVGTGDTRPSSPFSSVCALAGALVLCTEESPPTLLASRRGTNEVLWRTRLRALPAQLALGSDAVFFVTTRTGNGTRVLVRVELADGVVSFEHPLDLEHAELVDSLFVLEGSAIVVSHEEGRTSIRLLS